METQTPWLELLAQLRPRLAGRRDGHGHVGSLRWLENQMSQKGSSSGAVRNIVYRDIGTPTDKSTLRDILEKLAQDVGMIGDLLPQIALEGEMDLEVRQLLGREKRMVYRRFLNQLRGGKQPKMLVIGRHGAGKTMLMHQISTSYPDAFKIRIGGDFSSELERLAERLSLPSSVVAAPLSRLEPGAPFAVSGGLQAEISKQLVAALLKRGGGILLLRAGTRGNLGGNALRLTDGSSATPTRWAWHHLLEPLLNADLSVLALINDLEGLPQNLGSYGDPVELPPPTLEEARRFVRSKLPHLPPLEVERIVKQAGRDYEALGLLTLLSGVGPIEGESLPVLRDERLRDFLEALSVACPPEFGETDERILLGLLGRRNLEDLPSLEKAFLETAGRGRIRPTSRSLAEKLLERYSYDREARRTELQNKASQIAEELGDLERALHHALGGAVWARVADLISRGEGHLTFSTVENVWRVASEAEGVPAFCLDQLGQVVVEHYANLGRHSHYSMKKALEGLKNSQDPNLQIYAKVKEAEGLIDHARFEAAREAFQKLPADADRNLSAATRAELGLGYAAFARWEGNALQALQYVEEAVRHSRGVKSELLSTKVQYWRGLIHKDLGQWSEALAALGEVTTGGIPLLSSRARYHWAICGCVWASKKKPKLRSS